MQRNPSANVFGRNSHGPRGPGLLHTSSEGTTQKETSSMTQPEPCMFSTGQELAGYRVDWTPFLLRDYSKPESQRNPRSMPQNNAINK